MLLVSSHTSNFTTMDSNYGADRDRQPSQEQGHAAHFKAEPNSIRRGPWSPEEDQKLMEIISSYGPSNWVRISISLGSRSPKQCRERYHQNLKPSLNRNPITYEEGLLIEELVAKHGKKWAEIARHLTGRSDNAIKNWWNGGANKRRRASHVQVSTPGSTHNSSSAYTAPRQGSESLDDTPSSKENGRVEDGAGSTTGVTSTVKSVSATPQASGPGSENGKALGHGSANGHSSGSSQSHHHNHNHNHNHNHIHNHSHSHMQNHQVPLHGIGTQQYPGMLASRTFPPGLQPVLPYHQAAPPHEQFPAQSLGFTESSPRSVDVPHYNPFNNAPALPQIAFNTMIFNEQKRQAPYSFPGPNVSQHWAVGSRSDPLHPMSIDNVPLNTGKPGNPGNPNIRFFDDRRHSSSLTPVVSTSPALYSNGGAPQNYLYSYSLSKRTDSAELNTPHVSRNSSLNYYDTNSQRSVGNSTSTTSSSVTSHSRIPAAPAPEGPMGGELIRKRSFSQSQATELKHQPRVMKADAKDPQTTLTPPYKKLVKEIQLPTSPSSQDGRDCSKSMSVSSLIN